MSGNLQAALKSYTQALLLYGSTETNEYIDTLHNINVIKKLIEQAADQNRDDSTNNDTSSDSTGVGDTNELASPTDESNPNAAQSETNTQARIGGATGPGQTLDQSSLAANEGANSAALAHSDPNLAPSDATVRHNTPPPSESSSPDNRPQATPELVEGSSPVLSPYSEQWLRDLPQDPGGYLRRKFLYLYQTSQMTKPDAPTDTESTRY